MAGPVRQYVAVADGGGAAAARYLVAARNEAHARRLLENTAGTGPMELLAQDGPSPRRTALPLGQCRRILADGRLAPPRRNPADGAHARKGVKMNG